MFKGLILMNPAKSRSRTMPRLLPRSDSAAGNSAEAKIAAASLLSELFGENPARKISPPDYSPDYQIRHLLKNVKSRIFNKYKLCY
jgi:hypothetical protein